MRIKIGSRGSLLALWQARWVQDALHAEGVSSEIIIIKTSGDRLVDQPLADLGGKGLFVKEIEEALIEEKIDLAVHSMKDLPAQLPPALVIAAVTAREDPRDAFISRSGARLSALFAGARMGTSSLRRQAQVLAYRPDLQCVPLRGNLDTRLRKLAEHHCDAVIVAAAGLCRMGWTERVTEYLSCEISLPAIGQGAIGLECRMEDQKLRQQLMKLNDTETARCIQAERAMLLKLEGGCHTPLAGYATHSPSDQTLTLRGRVASPDGKTILCETETGTDPEAVGYDLAERLLCRGARLLCRG